MNKEDYNVSNKSIFRISIDGIAFFLLCCYTIFNTLTYTGLISENMVSLSLYGFIAVSVVSMLIHRYITIEKHIKWYACFGICCLLSCMYSPSFSVSFNSFIGVFKVLIYLFMLFEIVSSEKRINLLILVNSLSAFLIILFLIANNQFVVEERLGQSLTGNTNIFSSLIMIGAISSIFLFIKSSNFWGKIFLIIVFILQEYALALSGGRKFFIVPIMLLCAMLVFKSDNSGRKRVFRNIGIVLLIISGVFWAVFNVPAIYNQVGVRLEGLFDAFSNNGNGEASALIRKEMIITGFNGWKSSPLWGFGINSFVLKTSFGAYSHNNYIELLFDLGLIGFSIYYVHTLKFQF